MIQHIRYSNTSKHYGSEDAIPLIIIERDDLYAVISLIGAQLLEFCSSGIDYLWLSPNAVFEHGKSIRGGIPICAPWFGIHPDPTMPKHGFVRNHVWSLIDSLESDNGDISLTFSYQHKPNTFFQYPFSILYTIQIGSPLKLDIEITNMGDEIMPFSWAFHSYHPVTDLNSVRVTGLEHINYLDATNALQKQIQTDSINFNGEVDRVYENVPDTQNIIGTPNIKITGHNCPTAIVWNPGLNLARKMADVGEDGYQGYICVERGAAFADTLNIEGNSTYRANVSIRATKA